MKKLSLIVLCAMVGLLAAGCHTGMNSIENAEKAGIVHPITDMRFVMDEVLAKHVALLQVEIGRAHV